MFLQGENLIPGNFHGVYVRTPIVTSSKNNVSISVLSCTHSTVCLEKNKVSVVLVFINISNSHVGYCEYMCQEGRE